ncbi:heparan-alpha-glucosaminide N-acetyltransferase [Copidosoma floridanum]|uniref:heparan-alpha-glucosaminide N-acetyltransferase n=1 Tax=Copidosoma floridanum TaxID=29053 RepID=UPI0006C9B65C|nr:heparan-alpha-glucosaminide N-acetyltransferase [Copidosoma floridanum]XP_014204777.1 heparan-alpha-glucosaminide N-acetyltransferase [Copidosoma floridanum]XP_014204778.1 heparan-alpha-glucosaminide N-acetyltransferase [Copidosoma floridanum]XP_014204779.1 heparan-alpha-glucosaminide N-acetyltransferase [Copidosoma floridanum]XP_023247867.1 heparan-alpha-glucosaminide N-acetyltransferase [Copidosoma floridanum]
MLETMGPENVSGVCLQQNASLPIDTACLSVVNKLEHSITFLSVFDDCFTCDGQPVVDIPAHANTTIQVSTKYPLRLFYNDSGAEKPFIWCGESYSLQEHGRYGWNVTGNNSCSSVDTFYEPWSPYLPLLAALMVYVLVLVVLYSSKFIINVVKMYLRSPTEGQGVLDGIQELESTSQILTVSKTGTRMQALDAFRGIAVLLMIFVNNGAGEYVFLKHSAWNGLTVADLVLPWFAWAMGFAIVNSIRVQLRVSVTRKRLVVKQLSRAAKLILLGLLINSQQPRHTNFYITELRFPGVLQLLAVSYFIAASIETCFASVQRTFQAGRFIFLQDIIERWAQWIIVFAIVMIHICITFLLKVPGCPRGYIGPGGYHSHGQYANCTAGAAGYIDRLVFGDHMYMKKLNAVYGPTLPHDPEGLMNTLSAVIIVFLGVQGARIFVTYYQAESRIMRWVAWSALTGLIAGILCGFSKEKGMIPVNKNMMSLSFVLCTSSLAFLLFAVLYYLIDHKKLWSGKPFIYAGANSILLYVGHYLTMGLFPFMWNYPVTPTHASVLAMNLWTTMLWAVIAKILYKKEVLVTV